ncbi:sulfate ABC transporter ATP-binding protein, partial [Rhodanobacter denitrificans]|nr:sulfate ABC transporter ATP-binding protein [Rhodanobacter denitrificans]
AYVRPEHLALAVPAAQPGWTAYLRHVYPAGSIAHLELAVDSLRQTLEADVATDDLARLGLHAGMSLRVAPRSAVVFAQAEDGTPLPGERWSWRAGHVAPLRHCVTL